MAEELEETTVIETVLDQTDSLINLSNKAGDLEQIVTSNINRQPTDVGTVVDSVVETLEQEYPKASVSVEYDDDINLSLRPDFERALTELLENAIEHNDEDPTVSITIDTAPNAIEFHVTDNGLGLPEMEAEVLTTGEETPLSHGSGLGLWLIRWIVTSHGGSIDTTVTETGTRITLSIPRRSTVTTERQLPELTRGRDRFQAVFEEANDAIAILNDDARILNGNTAAETLFGLESKELLGQPLGKFVLGDDFESKWRDFQHTGASRGTIDIVDADGVEYTVEYSGKTDIIPGEHLLVGRDITEREERERELAAMKERYETLLSAAPVPVFVADAETGELIELNETAETLLGKPREQIIGRHQTTLHPPEDAELYREAFRQVTGEKTTVRTLPDGSQPELMTAGDESIPIKITVDTVSLPDGPVIYGILRQISDVDDPEGASI